MIIHEKDYDVIDASSFVITIIKMKKLREEMARARAQKGMIPLLTKEQLEEERERSKNLGWPYLPAIYKIPVKKKKNKPQDTAIYASLRR